MLPAGPRVANGVLAVREGLQPCRPATLANRHHDLFTELLDPEQLDNEIVEGVVALVHPREHALGAAICLDGGVDDDVGGAQRPDGLPVAP